MSAPADDSIWPPPKSIGPASPPCSFPLHIAIALDSPDLRPFFGRFEEQMAALGIEISYRPMYERGPRAAKIDVSISPEFWRAAGNEWGPRHQHIWVGDRMVSLIVADEPALRDALLTLEQHVRLLVPTASELRGPAATYVDHPDFEVRGVMLDVSRTRVPTMETLFALVERLAAWKINQLQLYMEHVFAYAGHETVWKDASPFTPDEIRALDAHCAHNGIELVPNQQSFGHMHRWLKHETYRDLAEVPEGLQHAFSTEREPYSLDLSDPGAQALLDDLYDQLLPCFASRQLNVGCDETFDLGLGKSKARCLERGTARVYLDYLLEIRRKVVSRGRTMQFWGDIVLQHPELVAELPKDMIALAWGYDAGHPFAENARHFAQSGLSFYVCPGTSSWQSIAGRTTNMLANLSEAARHGHAAGALGFLVTDWGDRGHLQPHLVTEVGLFTAAAFAWDSSIDLTRERLTRAIDRHLFLDDAGVMGKLVLELGDAYLETGCASTNGTALFFLLAFAGEPLPHARLPGLNAVGLLRTREYLLARRPLVDSIRSRRTDAKLLMAELRWMIDVLMFACDFGLARLTAPEPAPVKDIGTDARVKLAARLRPIIAEHRRLWLLRDRPGGLDESAGWLERVLDRLDA